MTYDIPYKYDDPYSEFVLCSYPKCTHTAVNTHTHTHTMNTHPEQYTAAITTTWLHYRRVRVLNWPACSPDRSAIKNIWRIIKCKIRQRRPRTLQQLETYISQERDQILTPKFQKLITSMPRCLQTVLKRRGVAIPW